MLITIGIGSPTVSPGLPVLPVDLFLNPFNSSSIHHRPVGSDAIYADDNHVTTLNLQEENFTNLNTDISYTYYLLKNSATDPVRNILWSGVAGTGFGLPLNDFHVPSILFTVGSASTYVIVTIYNYLTGNFNDFVSWIGNNGQPTADSHRTYAADGMGHGATKTGASASGQGLVCGLQRGHEINNDSFGPIRHAMQFYARASTPPQKMKNAFMWPAITSDTICSNIINCTGDIAYGSLFALPPSIYTDSYINSQMGLSTLGKRLAVQLRDYGGYFIDRASGSSSLSDQDVTRSTEYNTQMRIIYPHLRWIMNNAESQTCSGGGISIAINNAYDAAGEDDQVVYIRLAPIGIGVSCTKGSPGVSTGQTSALSVAPSGIFAALAIGSPELPDFSTEQTIYPFAPVQLVNAGERAVALNAAISPPLPVGWSAGNYFIAVVAFSSPAGSVTTPSGWTLLSTLTNSQGKLYIYSRFAQSSDTAPVFAVSGGVAADGILGGIVAFSGVNTSDPIASYGADTITTNPVVSIDVNAPDASGVVNGATIFIGARNYGYEATPPLTGDGLTWVEVFDFSEGDEGLYLIANVAEWTTTVPTLTNKTFVLQVGTGTTYGKALVFRPSSGPVSGFSFGIPSTAFIVKTSGAAVSTAFGNITAIGTGESFYRGFYQVSYGTDDSVGAANNAQIAAMVSQVNNTSHVIITLHLRTPNNTSNSVSRDTISENVANLAGWFQQVRDNNLRPAMAIILHVTDWDWAGFWAPTSPTTALANYYSAVRPWVQAAEANGAEFLILVDEWSTLFSNSNAVSAFQNLFTSARADYTGPIGVNLSGYEEADALSGVITLCDFVGVNAYVASAVTNSPSVATMKQNLIGTSTVPIVQTLWTTWRDTWNDQSVVGYFTYVKHLAEVTWNKDIILTVGYKSTVGAARNPSAQPSTSIDTAIQADAWQAFIEAYEDGAAGVGSRCLGVFGWMWWPGARFEDENGMGFTPQGKPAAARIGSSW